MCRPLVLSHTLWFDCAETAGRIGWLLLVVVVLLLLLLLPAQPPGEPLPPLPTWLAVLWLAGDASGQHEDLGVAADRAR